MKFVNKTYLDDRQIRTDWDTGFTEERRYGRGKSGGQVRDEYRDYVDPNRPRPTHYDTEQRQDFNFDDNTPRNDRYPGRHSSGDRGGDRGGHKRSRSEGGGYGDDKRHKAEENNRFRRERDEDDD